ncbi:signal peptidase II [Oscillatoria laete-virens NRMC-F 0139]|nr:signal peptidase II [Oscillatoria laete-virens]MDL5053156.1 signal peptidase II [Oscillatoria laete-virens NRMC-F 0139]
MKIPLITAFVILAADQLSKIWMSHLLGTGDHYIRIIPGFFHLEYVVNTGAAFGILQGRSWPLAIFAVIVLGFLFVFRKDFFGRNRLQQFAGGLIVGGIIGNVIDRLRIGGVIDFFKFIFGSYVWPNFNIADSAICVGVALYIFVSWKTAKAENAGASSTSNAA